MTKDYETPEIKELGSLSDLTLLGTPKFDNLADGFSYNGQDIGQPT